MHPSSPVSPLSTSVYRLAALGNLPLGYRIASQVASDQLPVKMSSLVGESEWTIQPGTYTAKQLVAGVAPLLDAVVGRLGPDDGNQRSARETLIDGLAASLTTSGRESTLPISPSGTDSSRREILGQAIRIGKTIVRYARSAPQADEGNWVRKVRSPCEGHLWAPATAALLLGPRSGSDLMELYNEWLHQLILLRDVLLPFENFEEVPLRLPPSSSRGLRQVDDRRRFFLLECLTRIISQAAVIDLAKALTAPALLHGGYGFQYAHGMVLPAFLSGSSSLHLLRYHPARVDASVTDLLFDYELKDYCTAPRSEIPARKDERGIPPGSSWTTLLSEVDPSVSRSALELRQGSDERRRILKLRLEFQAGCCVEVDLGQIARGRRYAYRPSSCASAPNGAKSESLSGISTVHKPSTILAQPGLVASYSSEKTKGANDVHILIARDPIVSLALLGKLYPENVILVPGPLDPGIAAGAGALGVGKGFGPRFIIYEGHLEAKKEPQQKLPVTLAAGKHLPAAAAATNGVSGGSLEAKEIGSEGAAMVA